MDLKIEIKISGVTKVTGAVFSPLKFQDKIIQKHLNSDQKSLFLGQEPLSETFNFL